MRSASVKDPVRPLRLLCLGLDALALIACLIGAAASYPLIIIADSDRGRGAYNIVHDMLVLAGCWLGLLLFAIIPGGTVMRIARTLGALGILAALLMTKPVGETQELFFRVQMFVAGVIALHIV